MARSFVLVLLLAVLPAALGVTIATQGLAAEDGPPVDLEDPAVVHKGEELYGQTCRYCHGKEGQGGRGPTLRGRGFDYRHVYDRITNGYPPMPAFGQVYSPEQVWEIVAFVQSMK